MPQTTIAEGDTQELITLNRFGAISINPSGGSIRYAESRSDARRGTLIPNNDRRTFVASRKNETFYIYGESLAAGASTITVDFRKQGFIEIIFARSDVNVFDETNYPNANATVSSSYPISVDETWTIKELIVFDVPADKTLDITTSGGTTINGIEPKRAGFVLDRIDIDSFDVNDPQSSGGETSALWSGE